MKKTIKIILIIYSFIFFVPRVYAYKIGDSFTVRSAGTNSATVFGGSNGVYELHTATGPDGKTSDAYCLNKAKSFGTNYVVTDLLPSSSVYQNAMAKLMNDKRLTDKEEMLSAVRMLESVLGKGEVGSDAKYNSQLTEGVSCLMNNPTFKAAMQNAGLDFPEKSSCNANLKQKLNEMAGPMADALNYAANLARGNGENQTKVDKGPIGEVRKGSGVSTRVVAAKVDIYNIVDPNSPEDKEYFQLLGYTVDNSQNPDIKVEFLGVSKEFSESGWQKIDFPKDISQFLKDVGRKGTLYVGFKLTLPEESAQVADESGENCDVDITINYKYTTNVGGAILKPANGGDNLQAFAISFSEPIEDKYVLKAGLCNGDSCEPYAKFPTICADGDTPDENGNVEYEFREAYDDSNGYNIKKCILQSKDLAGNSYKLNDGYSNMVSNNRYCAVYCKEDYIFEVPYKRYAESGRYFQISVKARGEQDCYTSGIDPGHDYFEYKKYTYDIVLKQQEILHEYNEYRRAYEIVNKISAKDGDELVCYKEVCEDGADGCESGEQRNESKGNELVIQHNTMLFKDWEIWEEPSEWKIRVWDKNWEPDVFGKVEENEYGSCSNSCSTQGYTCKIKTADEDYKEQYDTYKAIVDGFEGKIKQLMEELRQIVDMYNSCVADHTYKGNEYSDMYKNSAYWDMNYNYLPTISYSYEEPEPGISTINWIDKVKDLNCSGEGVPDGRCNIMVSTNEKMESELKVCQNRSCGAGVGQNGQITDTMNNGGTIPVNQYCEGDIDKEYECKGIKHDSVQFEDEETYNKNWYYQCNDEGGVWFCKNTYEGYEYDSKFFVTKINHLRKTGTSSGEYLTSRVYYSGHDDGDIKIEGTPVHKIQNYDLVDGLPVGINTPQGLYFYTLTFDKIGSYYSPNTEEKMGRLFGTDATSVVQQDGVRSESVTLNMNYVDKNEYACSYEVDQTTCTDANGKVHYKTECEPENCKTNEDGSKYNCTIDWDKCKQDLCPTSDDRGYCIKAANSYYVCDHEYFDGTCRPYSNREEAIKNSKVNYSCCPECKVQCIGQCSIVHESSSSAVSQLNFRTVSPGNLFTTERLIGYNWNPDPEVYNNSLVALKAKETIEEIEERANDLESGSTSEITPSDGKVRDYSLKVTMNPDMINKIRDYNKEAGSYNNDTLTCYDHIVSLYENDEEKCTNHGYSFDKVSGKCIMKNIFCYSTFITDLLNGEYGGNASVSTTGRSENIEKLHETFTTIPLETNQGNKLVSDYWTIYQFTSIDTNGDGFPDIGPSWK